MSEYIMNRESLRKHCEKMCKIYESAPLSNAYMEHKLVLELLEQTTWIPCSEDLPKNNGWYHCTVALNNLSLVMDLYYKNGKWLDNRRIDMFNIYEIYGYGNTAEKHKLSYQELISEFDWTKNVVAWMPLPESYKIESENDKE